MDIDDALSVRRLPNGRVEVGVHIADVSHFVAAGSPLDAEAMDRCTTVYFVDRRLDMLPSRLSTNVCSLRARADRFALSVLWELDDLGPAPGLDGRDPRNREFRLRPERTWMGPTLIRSTHALTYAQAQSLAEGLDPATGRPWSEEAVAASAASAAEYADPPEGGVCGAAVFARDFPMLRDRMALLMAVSRWVLRARRAAGALSFEGVELRFKLRRGVARRQAERGDAKEEDERAGGAAKKGREEEGKGEGKGEEEREEGDDADLGDDAEVQPEDLEEEDHCEMHSTVEELMILANAAVAKRIVAAFPECSLLRRHDPAAQERFKDVVALASAAGIEIATSTNAALAASLSRLRGGGDGAGPSAPAAALLQSMTVMAMSEALYVGTGTALQVAPGLLPTMVWAAARGSGVALADSAVPEAAHAPTLDQTVVQRYQSPAWDGLTDYVRTPFAHYGLALEFYTHFTSPIRRYADIVVHRLLRAALGLPVRPEERAAVSVDSGGGVVGGDGVADDAGAREAGKEADGADARKGGEEEGEEEEEEEEEDEEDEALLDSLLGFGGAGAKKPSTFSEAARRAGGSASADVGADAPSSASSASSSSAPSASSSPASSTPSSSLVSSTSSSSSALGSLAPSVGRRARGTALPPFNPRELDAVCERINDRHRAAKLASRECDELFLALLVRKRCEVVEAVVSSCRKNGLLVFVPKFDVQGPVFLANEDGAVSAPPALFGWRPARGGRDLVPAVRPTWMKRGLGDERPATPRAVDERRWALHELGCSRVPLPGAVLTLSADGNALELEAPVSTPEGLELRDDGRGRAGRRRTVRFAPLQRVLVVVWCDFRSESVRRPPLRFELVASTPETEAMRDSAAEAVHPPHAPSNSVASTVAVTTSTRAEPTRRPALSLYQSLPVVTDATRWSSAEAVESVVGADEAESVERDDAPRAKTRVRVLGSGRLVFGALPHAVTDSRRRAADGVEAGDEGDEGDEGEGVLPPKAVAASLSASGGGRARAKGAGPPLNPLPSQAALAPDEGVDPATGLLRARGASTGALLGNRAQLQRMEREALTRMRKVQALAREGRLEKKGRAK